MIAKIKMDGAIVTYSTNYKWIINAKTGCKYMTAYDVADTDYIEANIDIDNALRPIIDKSIEFYKKGDTNA